MKTRFEFEKNDFIFSKKKKKRKQLLETIIMGKALILQEHQQ